MRHRLVLITCWLVSLILFFAALAFALRQGITPG